MEAISDDDSQKPVTAGTWIGFGAMCVGMFMAILDVQIVAMFPVALVVARPSG